MDAISRREWHQLREPLPTGAFEESEPLPPSSESPRRPAPPQTTFSGVELGGDGAPGRNDNLLPGFDDIRLDLGSDRSRSLVNEEIEEFLPDFFALPSLGELRRGNRSAEPTSLSSGSVGSGDELLGGGPFIQRLEQLTCGTPGDAAAVEHPLPPDHATPSEEEDPTRRAPAAPGFDTAAPLRPPPLGFDVVERKGSKQSKLRGAASAPPSHSDGNTLGRGQHADENDDKETASSNSSGKGFQGGAGANNRLGDVDDSRLRRRPNLAALVGGGPRGPRGPGGLGRVGPAAAGRTRSCLGFFDSAGDEKDASSYSPFDKRQEKNTKILLPARPTRYAQFTRTNAGLDIFATIPEDQRVDEGGMMIDSNESDTSFTVSARTLHSVNAPPSTAAREKFRQGKWMLDSEYEVQRVSLIFCGFLPTVLIMIGQPYHN